LSSQFPCQMDHNPYIFILIHIGIGLVKRHMFHHILGHNMWSMELLDNQRDHHLVRTILIKISLELNKRRKRQNKFTVWSMTAKRRKFQI
jgi:hypothetical protein